MEQFLTVFETTALLCLLIIPGLIFKKLKLGEGAFGKGISNIILYVAQPCLLISPYIRDFDVSVLLNMGITLLFSFAIHGICAVFGFVFFKDSSSITDKVLRIATIFANCGYMGIPLITMVLGSEFAIYATVYNIGFQMFLWTIGWFTASGDRKYISVKKMFVNPAMISIYIGLCFFFLPINNYVPKVILSTMNTLKELVIPLSMFLVGFHMAENKLKTIFLGKKMWFAILLRLIVIPFVVFWIMKLLIIIGLPLDRDVLMVSLIVAGTPCATITAVLTEKFDLDREVAGRIVPISTILSVVTLPIIAMVGKMI